MYVYVIRYFNDYIEIFCLRLTSIKRPGQRPILKSTLEQITHQSFIGLILLVEAIEIVWKINYVEKVLCHMKEKENCIILLVYATEYWKADERQGGWKIILQPPLSIV